MYITTKSFKLAGQVSAFHSWFAKRNLSPKATNNRLLAQSTIEMIQWSFKD